MAAMVVMVVMVGMVAAFISRRLTPTRAMVAMRGRPVTLATP